MGIFLYPLMAKNDDEAFEKENIISARKTIHFPFLTNKLVSFVRDEKNNWTINFEEKLLLSEIISDENKPENTKDDYMKTNSDTNKTKNSITFLKESCSSIIGNISEIIYGKHIIKKFILINSVLKTQSLKSLIGLSSPYIIYPSSIQIVFRSVTNKENSERFYPFNEINTIDNENEKHKITSSCDFILEFGGGETFNGSYWIDTEVENFPVFKGEFFENEKTYIYFEEAFRKRRLDRKEINRDFPHLNSNITENYNL